MQADFNASIGHGDNINVFSIVEPFIADRGFSRLSGVFLASGV